jgi:hypothetical protein
MTLTIISGLFKNCVCKSTRHLLLSPIIYLKSLVKELAKEGEPTKINNKNIGIIIFLMSELLM